MIIKKVTSIEQVVQYIEETARLMRPLKPKFGSCAICNFPLTVSYPEDYPDEWKFCCSCWHWAGLISRDDPIVNFLHVKNSPILREINNRITLVKGNDGKR